MKEKGKNIILTGFMGSGKTSLGIRLSYRLRIPFLDTDKWIEGRQGQTITEIFAEQGEEAFRSMETEALREIGKNQDRYVISTGGGTPMREENRRLLKQMGTVVFLKIRPETVYERLKGDTTRPLLAGNNPKEKIRSLMEQRNPLYEAGADVIVNVDGKDYDTLLSQLEKFAGGL